MSPRKKPVSSKKKPPRPRRTLARPVSKKAAPPKRRPAVASEPAAVVVKRARAKGATGGTGGNGGAARAAASPAARKFAAEAGRLMGDLHCENVVIFDTHGKSDVMDFVIIASGTSDRQMRSLGDDLRELARQHGLSVYGEQTDERTTWIVIDLVEVVIHLFEPQTRAFYDLEMMWGDCPQVKWKR